MYQKSLCSEIGQQIDNNRSREKDSTCSCDYAEGFGFVTQPKNIKYCIPSKEDCSCYLVQCADNNTLSSGKLGLNFESRVWQLLCETSNSNGQQYNQPQQYEPLLCQTLNSNGQQYNQPQKYEPLFCQTINSNGQQYDQPQQYEPLLC